MVNEQLQAEFGILCGIRDQLSGTDGWRLRRAAGSAGNCLYTDGGIPGSGAAVCSEKSAGNTVAQFRDGVKAYTAGVGEAAGGSQELFQGDWSVLHTASEPLVDGTDAVVDALMDLGRRLK